MQMQTGKQQSKRVVAAAARADRACMRASARAWLWRRVWPARGRPCMHARAVVCVLGLLTLSLSGILDPYRWRRAVPNTNSGACAAMRFPYMA